MFRNILWDNGGILKYGEVAEYPIKVIENIVYSIEVKAKKIEYYGEYSKYITDEFKNIRKNQIFIRNSRRNLFKNILLRYKL